MKLSEVLMAYGKVWVHLVRTAVQLTYGIWKISQLEHPLVSIFGSSKVAPESEYAQLARMMGARLADADISVITGGGPGIMEAANCGAQRTKGEVRTLGISVRGLEHERRNLCVDDYMVMSYYFSRKWLLTQYSIAFIIFPGGVGTLEELAELLTLMQTRARAHAPIVLLGEEYWDHIVRWLREQALPNKLIFASDLERITVTDDIDLAYKIVKDYCEACR